MQKNRERTRAGIIAAVGRLLARAGFRDLGINAIAREAGVDKVLIYRYFGGMEELLKAYAAEGDFWPSAEDLLEAVQRCEPKTDAELAAALLIEFGRALRRRPMTQEILRWELLERNEVTDTLARYREEESIKLLTRLKRTDVDVAAVASLLAAGQTYLTLRAKTAEVYNGLRLNDERDWNRLESALRTLVALTLGGSEGSTRSVEAPVSVLNQRSRAQK
jgi:AcrR family transcriptional regulator